MAESNSNARVEVSDPDAFEHYYRKAASGRDDGLIDYSNYLDFLDGSYLPKLIFDKIWVVINRKKSETAVLIGREEFYEALQLTSLGQKSKREGTLVDFANQLSDILGYDTNVLPMLPNILPPDNDTVLLPSPYLDVDGTLRVFAPRPRVSSHEEPQIQFPIETCICTREPFDLYIRIGDDVDQPYEFHNKYSVDRVTTFIPFPINTIEKHIFVPPTPVSLEIESWQSWKDRMKSECMERWEDLPDGIKKLAIKELSEEFPDLVRSLQFRGLL